MSRTVSLTTFLDATYKDGSMTFNTPVILFGARQYPLLFFSLLLKIIRKNPHNYVTVLDLKAVSKSDAQRTLQSTFLGLKTVFWLGYLTDLSASEHTAWLEYLAVYKGPNVIIACAENNEQLQKVAATYIDIPDALSLEGIMLIASLISEPKEQQAMHYFFKKVLEIAGTVTLDHVCLLSAYAQVLSKNDDQFYKEVVPLIVPPSHSLFALSDAFFDKNIKKFFALWQPLSAQFSIQFWISFWSEQLWRAYFYVSCMKGGRIAEAKKIMYRLPYSFTQKSWKNYTLEPFVKGHAFLYTLDYEAKNGAIAQEAMVDLFCMKFMSEAFYSNQ